MLCSSIFIFLLFFNTILFLAKIFINYNFLKYIYENDLDLEIYRRLENTEKIDWLAFSSNPAIFEAK
jgi:hypothetical protein